MVTLVNRAKMSTSTTGTGTITLGSAEAGYQSFAAAGVADGDVVRYVIEDGDNWEIGSGTYTATGTTLTRTVSESSNAGAAISLTGSAVVYVSAAAGDVFQGELFAENPSTPTAPSATGLNAVAIGSGATASGELAISMTRNAVSSGYASFAAGNVATATGGSAVSIGGLSDATGDGSTAIGFLAQATSYRSTAVGYGANAVTNARATALTNSYASGTDSLAAAIANNTSSYGATGQYGIAIGRQSKASGANSTAIGTFRATASGSQSIALGYFATASSAYAISIGGTVTADTIKAVALGYEAKSSIQGKFAYSGGAFSSAGDAQTGTFVLRSDTTDATPEALTTNNAAAGTTNQIILPNNSAYAFHGTIVARQQASQGTASAAWKVEGLIRREGSAGTTVLVNSATTVLDNTPSWGMALSADTTNGGLAITVTGAAATNIRFVATISTSEVTY